MDGGAPVLDDVDRLGVSHAVRFVVVNLQDLVTHLQSTNM